MVPMKVLVKGRRQIMAFNANGRTLLVKGVLNVGLRMCSTMLQPVYRLLVVGGGRATIRVVGVILVLKHVIRTQNVLGTLIGIIVKC